MSRSPRLVYFKHGVVEFYTKHNEIYFKVKLWLHNGLKQIIFREGKFNVTTDELIKEASQFHESEILTQHINTSESKN